MDWPLICAATSLVIAALVGLWSVHQQRLYWLSEGREPASLPVKRRIIVEPSVDLISLSTGRRLDASAWWLNRMLLRALERKMERKMEREILRALAGTDIEPPRPRILRPGPRWLLALRQPWLESLSRTHRNA